MKRVVVLSLVILFVVGVSMALILGLSRQIPAKDFPKEVPIVKGKVVSATSTRSDDLTRGIEIVVETNLSLKEVADYYTDEFSKRDFRVATMPTFSGNTGDLENSTEADAIAETKNQQQVVVLIRVKQELTQVTIQVKGNSILFLPQ